MVIKKSFKFIKNADRGSVRFVSWRIADNRKESQALKFHSNVKLRLMSDRLLKATEKYINDSDMVSGAILTKNNAFFA